MPKKVEPVPNGFRTVTPALIVHDGAAALKFYENAFGAKVRNQATGPGGKLWHAEVEIGDSVVMVSDESPQMGSKSPKTLGGSPVGIWLYLPDVDASHKRALSAGAVSMQEPRTEFWGDRFAAVTDPFGHLWVLATHVEDVTPEEMERRRVEALKAMSSRPANQGGRSPSP